MRSLTAPPWRLEKVFISIGARFGYVLDIVSREAELPQQAAGAWQNEPLAQLGIFALVDTGHAVGAIKWVSYLLFLTGLLITNLVLWILSSFFRRSGDDRGAFGNRRPAFSIDEFSAELRLLTGIPRHALDALWRDSSLGSAIYGPQKVRLIKLFKVWK